VLPPIRDVAGLAALQSDRLLDRFEPSFETVRRVRRMLLSEGFGETSLIGFPGAPFTVACRMVEGEGSRDFAVTHLLAFDEPARSRVCWIRSGLPPCAIYSRKSRPAPRP